MKKIAKLLFASAALLTAFVSCQKVEEISEAPKTTHTVKFMTEMPTKTSYVVEGNSVKYKWEEADIANLKVFEDGKVGTIIVEGDNKSYIDEGGILNLIVTFEGSGEGPHIYTANLNGGVVKSEQLAANDTYDPTCDVLVAKPTSSTTFQFRRPVAITELKLKNLTAEEKVSKVTIISDSEHPIAGKYTQNSTDDSTGDWSESSNKIVVTFGTEQDGTTPKTKTVGSDGILPLSIVTCPIKEASVKVLVETENGLKYRKVTASALTLLADVVKAQGIGLTSVTEAEHAEDGWYLVTDANELFDGDEIRIASPSKGMIAGDFTIVKEKITEYLVANTATFTPSTYDQLTGIDSENRPNTFTLVENYGSFALVNENGKLGTKSNEAMSYDDGTKEYSGATEWTIAIADNLATISTGETYGRILCNVNSSRFRNYTSSTSVSMLLPHIYKKYGTPEDPIIKIARTASFSPESTTVTIDADDNVFPELSFEPAGATEGARTWSSSDTEVATVDNEGNVTLLTDGTTTISVEIAATDTYQPCSASYELTVNPAAVEGVDYLDRNFTGISDGVTTYADWSGKVGSSGNTYAGNSAGNNNAIQLRSDKNTAGIVVTNSASNQVARKVTVDWESHTSNGRTLDIYGKSTAYTAASDLYSNDTQGTKLGSIVYGTSTELTITGDYKYIGIRSNNGAHFLNWIKIQWEDEKPKYVACFKDACGNAVTEVNATVGEEFTAPSLYVEGGLDPEVTYASSDGEVASVAEGVVTLHKKGDATITATLEGDATHKTTSVPYTIHVANVLSSIEITTEPTKKSYYVGDKADYSGIAVTANYNDNTSAEIVADKLNFSGFDSSVANPEQTITVSYTENDVTKTDSYTVEIVEATTLYGIDVTGAVDANGNSVTVDGGKDKAEEGDEITLNVNLNTGKGYKLTSLKVNEVEHCSDVTEGKYTFTMPAEAVTVTANFDNHYNVVLGSATNGSFTVNGGSASPVSVVYGTTVNLVATPAAGYVFKTWTVEGATVASATDATTTFTMPAREVTVSAEFEQPKDATYFYESFNECSGTGGNDNQWSGSIASSTLTADNTGWTFTSGGGADKCAKFGAGSTQGSAETPDIDINTTTAMLRFKAAAWNGSDEKTTLNITATNATLGQSSVTLVKGSWETYTVAVSTVTGKVKIKFEAANASKNRFFLDEVYVYYGTAPATPKENPTITATNKSITLSSGQATQDLSEMFDSNSTGDITYSLKVSSSTASISGSTFSATAKGDYVIVASQAAAGDYNAGSAEATITVNEEGQSGGTTWTRVTTIKELTDGGTFIMGYEATAKSGVIVPLRTVDCNATTSANGYFNTGTTANSSTSGTIDMSKITATSDYELIIESPSSGVINLKSANTNNYFGATSGGTTSNKARLYTAGNSNETNLTPEFTSEENNQFKLTAGVSGQYKYLKYNTSSPRFAYYNSAGSNIVFYKKSN